MKVVNPANEEIIAELSEDTLPSIQDKYRLLKDGQEVWRQVPLKERLVVIRRFASLLKNNIEELSVILTSEVGKPLQQSRNEVSGACARIHWMAEHSEKYLSDETVRIQDGLEEKISYEPLGVVCNISAWNYPYLVGMNVLVPALLAGNTVLYKPSEFALLTGLEIQKYMWQAGVPSSAFQTAIGGGEVGKALLSLPVDGYFFTGSYKTGKYIYEAVATKMVPCQLELGGKDPLYVADDVADVKNVAVATADGAFYNNGQSCCSVERIYVHENVYDRYVDEFVNEVKRYRAGNPLEKDTYIGPLTRAAQLEILEQQVLDAVSKGATIRTGGHRMDRKGYYFEPTVLTEVDHHMLVMKEESFGPIIGIMKVANDDEALRLMQDTEYGLTASVYSASQQRAEKILSQLNTGTGYWNCCDRVSPALPWSGRKHSGLGATLSHLGLRAFTKPKAYHMKG